MSVFKDKVFFLPLIIVLAAALGACSDKATDTPAAQPSAQAQAPDTMPAEMPEPKAEMPPPVEEIPDPEPAATTAAAPDGKAVYNQGCVACHAMGIAGAPKFASVEAWEPRIAQGIDVLYDHSINGYKGKSGIMPPKGGRLDLSDEAVKAAVDYMVEAAQ